VIRPQSLTGHTATVSSNFEINKYKKMTEENNFDLASNDDVQKDIGTTKLVAGSTGIPISPYSNIQRSISEEDLKSPAIQRILLSEVDKLESKAFGLESSLKASVSEFNNLRDKFHLVDKDKSILDEKLKTNKAQEVLYSFCLTSGSIIIGLAKTVWEQGLGGIFLALGLFLIIGGLITKIIKWK